MLAIINSILFHILLKTTFLVFEICSVIFQICEPYYKTYTFMFINWAANTSNPLLLQHHSYLLP